MSAIHPMVVLGSFSIKDISYYKIDLRLLNFDVAILLSAIEAHALVLDHMWSHNSTVFENSYSEPVLS